MILFNQATVIATGTLAVVAFAFRLIVTPVWPPERPPLVIVPTVVPLTWTFRPDSVTVPPVTSLSSSPVIVPDNDTVIEPPLKFAGRSGSLNVTADNNASGAPFSVYPIVLVCCDRTGASLTLLIARLTV